MRVYWGAIEGATFTEAEARSRGGEVACYANLEEVAALILAMAANVPPELPPRTALIAVATTLAVAAGGDAVIEDAVRAVRSASADAKGAS